MKFKCSVEGCESVQGSKPFFAIPQSREENIKWLSFINVSGKKTHPNVEYRVCGDHFLSSDFRNCKRKLLKHSAIPSILVPQVNVIQSVNISNILNHKFDFS
jgi:THAP domain